MITQATRERMVCELTVYYADMNTQDAFDVLCDIYRNGFKGYENLNDFELLKEYKEMLSGSDKETDEIYEQAKKELV